MKNIIFLLFICLLITKANAFGKEKYTEDIFYKRLSSVFLFKKDSLINVKYKEIAKLRNKEEYYTALKEALSLLDLSKKNDNQYWTFKITYLIGDIYKRTNKLEKSLKFYKDALSLVEQPIIDRKNVKFTDLEVAKTLLRLGTSYHNISSSIDLTKNYSYIDSIKFTKQKKIYKDSARFYYEKIEKLPDFNYEVQNLKAVVFSNISTIYEVDSSYVKAREYIEKAIEINKKNNNSLKTANSLNNLGNIYLSQEKYLKSKSTYLDALKMIKNNNNPNAVRTKATLYFNLAWAMRNLEEFEAYDYQEMSYEIQDDMRDKEFRGIIEEINAEYDVDAAKRDVRLEEENKRIKAQSIFWFAGILALIIIISLVYLIKLNTLKQKNLALKLSQTELIQNQEIEKFKSETQDRILNATIDGKESERKQIAETLHDSVSALLSSANLHLQATRKQFNGSTPIEIDKTQEIIQEASHKIRDLSHNLVSSVLLKFGLNFAISDIAEKYSNSVLKIDTEILEVRRYEENFEIKIHNIIQEFVNNILKHSLANNALIELKEDKKRLILTISDDGVGFDKTKITQQDGLGINQIDARIKMMNGKFHIDSSSNNGTKISVEIPVVEKEEPNFV